MPDLADGVTVRGQNLNCARLPPKMLCIIFGTSQNTGEPKLESLVLFARERVTDLGLTGRVVYAKDGAAMGCTCLPKKTV